MTDIGIVYLAAGFLAGMFAGYSLLELTFNRKKSQETKN